MLYDAQCCIKLCLSYADDNLKSKICKDIVENEKFMALAYSELGTENHFYISDVKTEFKR